MKYIVHILIGVTQLGNAFIGGHPKESVSGRSHREPWPVARRVINGLFFWQADHCKSAHESDVRWAREFVSRHDSKGATDA